MTNHQPIIELPQYATSLIGRVRARTSLIELIDDPDKRLISLIGSSGAGKTRLALQVAQEVSSRYDRVVFVALAPVRFSIFVLPTIAHALGLRESANQSLIEAFVSNFEDQRILLLLDNFEQVVSAGATINKLIEQLPLLTVLVTSQIPLEVPQETAFEVPPLSIPTDKQLTVDEALAFSAVRLFIERIKAVQSQFEFKQEHVSPIIEICQRVRGLPLAIELVAAHSQVLDPQDLSMLLRNHLALGRSMRSASAGSRQEMLWPVLDWCYQMLDPSIRTLFDRMGVFWGGCTKESAEVVCNYDQGLQIDIESGLSVLIDKHLIQTETLPDQSTRYIMLDAVQEYTSEHLQRQRDSEALQEAHADYYRAISQEAYTKLQGPEQVEWFQRLNESLHNIRRALDWSLNRTSVERALHIAANLLIFWQMQGYLTEGRNWLEQALLKADEHVDPPILGQAQNAAGILAWFQGDLAEAQTIFEDLLNHYQNQDDHSGMVKVISNLGNIQYSLGNYQAALDRWLESLEILKTLNDPVRTAMLMSNIGVLYSILGQLEEGYRYKQQTLQLQRDHQASQTDLATTLNNLGIDAILLTRYDEALAYLEESYALLKGSNERVSISEIASNLALVKWELGEHAAARQFATESLFTRHEMDAHQHIPSSIVVFAVVYADKYPQLITRMLGYMQQQLEEREIALLPYVEKRSKQLQEYLQEALGMQWAAIWEQGRSEKLADLLAEFEQ